MRSGRLFFCSSHFYHVCVCVSVIHTMCLLHGLFSILQQDYFYFYFYISSFRSRFLSLSNTIHSVFHFFSCAYTLAMCMWFSMFVWRFPTIRSPNNMISFVTPFTLYDSFELCGYWWRCRSFVFVVYIFGSIYPIQTHEHTQQNHYNELYSPEWKRRSTEKFTEFE